MRLKNRYEELVSKNVSIVKVGLINGYEIVNLDFIVGFCHCLTHRGILTENQLKKHECIEKRCPFLEKYKDYPFWKKFERKQEELSKKKSEIKRKKKNATNIKNAEQKQINEMLEAAREIQRRFNYSIIITSIKKDNQFDYVVNYVSESPLDDWCRYVPLAVGLHKSFERTFKMNHIKNVNGSFATFDDYNRREKN